ncbi:MAG: rod shape-determining protein MreC [Rikenellaceae bacterium]
MFRLFEFLRSISLLLLFLILESAAILYYAHSNSYTQAKILSISSGLIGGVGGLSNGIGSYFSLYKVNKQLLGRIVDLESEVADYRAIISDSMLMALHYHNDNGVRYMAARVVSNSINKPNNYIIINRGLEDGVRVDMAVLTPNNEMVGYVVECSGRFAIVMSILNRDFRSSGKLDDDNHAGSINWSGESRYHITMSELSKYTNIYEGAEVVTTGFSQLFPEGVKIGEVESFELNNMQTAFNVNVRLAADISALNEVLVVNNIATAEARYILQRIEAGEVDLDE